ncbi:ABC transporter permease [Desnuesiella massiliensis]|uniref:ABC transporter permease n=1 Tax=Desnuesiella massiliensis TaxID=1650662 RepID=UPI0006E15C5E|nr:ABC transporter permease [Desnuesiella massiliensis]
MNFVQAFKMAIKSIVGNKIRSLLTMLGVIIGVGAVIAATAFAEGSTKQITDSIQGLGTNLVQVTITGRNSNRNVSYEDLEKLKEENSSLIASIAPQVSSSVTVKVGSKSRTTTVIGTSPDYEIIKNTHVQSGRFLIPLDIDYNQKVALVGTAVVNDIFQGANPIDKTLKINGIIFKVVGVLEEKENGGTQTADDQIIIPVSVAARITGAGNAKNFLVQATAAETVDKVVEVVTVLLTKVYKNSNTFRVFNQAQMLSTLNTITGTMMLILGGIATISLVVGGIGIMNIMLVSVTERTREIGIRKSIGAKKKNILTQFLIEALMVTGIGGIIGVIFGLSIIKFIIGGFKIVPEVYSIKWIMLSFGISLIIGVVFGMYPAKKAANLNPIDALMYE